MKFLFSCSLLFFLTACQTTAPVMPVEPESTQQGMLAVDDSNLTKKSQSKAIVDLDNGKEYKNIWLKLAKGFDFEVPDNSRIAKQRDYYLRHPNYLKQVSKRAEPFLYLIVEQIEAKGLPLELALLPVVESTFDPFAYSSASASGLWQFMPVTGKRFGLEQDWWYDGRRDVYASTIAALSYMEILHDYLGDDWLYAFAAYNSGEGRVQRAVRKNKKNNKPVDYWNLSLPKETENYVPKLLALVDILRNHKKYGIELPYIENKQVLTYVDTKSQLDLAYAAQLANLSVAEIQQLNPAFNHWATSPNGPHKLLIPTVVADEFVQKLSATDKNSRLRWARYKVRSGDSLSMIAKNHGTTTSVLKQINDLRGSFIKIGQPLLIPTASQPKQGSLYTQAKRVKTNKSKEKRKVIHTVVQGDTLWKISRLYKVTHKEVAKWNQMTTKKTLRLGEKLTIWKVAKVQPPKPRQVTYKVRSGDSLGGIAQNFNVKTTDLVRWNKLKKQKYIQPGQTLLVYVESHQPRG